MIVSIMRARCSVHNAQKRSVICGSPPQPSSAVVGTNLISNQVYKIDYGPTCEAQGGANAVDTRLCGPSAFASPGRDSKGRSTDRRRSARFGADSVVEHRDAAKAARTHSQTSSEYRLDPWSSFLADSKLTTSSMHLPYQSLDLRFVRTANTARSRSELHSDWTSGSGRGFQKRA
jgi:hypothetical protein